MRDVAGALHELRHADLVEQVRAAAAHLHRRHDLKQLRIFVFYCLSPFLHMSIKSAFINLAEAIYILTLIKIR